MVGSRSRCLVVIVLLSFCVADSICADQRANARFVVDAVDPVIDVVARDLPGTVLTENTAPGQLGSVAFLALRIYQRVISPLDRPSCMFEPTCSSYALEAIRRYGLVRGLIMAADRLHRCNGVGREFYPVNPSTGKLIDPP